MADERIRLDMTMEDVIITMAEGNPGAACCMAEMLAASPMNILKILNLDSLGIHGSKIYMLWNDCCGRDMDKLIETIAYLNSGKVSREEIHANLNQVRAKPFI